MKKENVLWILLDLIFLVVFNVVFFVIGGQEHPFSTWISYGFIHLSYIMVVITPFLLRKCSSTAVFGFSLYAISSTYFLVEFVVGVVCIFFKSELYKTPLVIQVVIAGIYGVLLLSYLIANERTADRIEKHEEEVSYIKKAASRVKALVGKSTDRKTNKEIEKAYDILHSSPTKSTTSVHTIENSVMDKIAALEDAVDSDNSNVAINLAAEIVALMEERNRKIRLSD